MVAKLNADAVASLQVSVSKNEDIGKLVAKFTDATLPGLLEYGCLRWAAPDSFPLLPKAIHDSRLGRAILAVPSDLGLQRDRPIVLPARRLDAQVAEFHRIDRDWKLASEDWKQFCIRFGFSAKKAGIETSVVDLLSLALDEMSENAWLHSETPVAALAGYHVTEGTATFCVVDVGIGVLTSLRKNPTHSGLADDPQALRKAMQPGATCLSAADGGGGYGFDSVFKAIPQNRGTLRFRSGTTTLVMQGTELNRNLGTFAEVIPMKGFQVSICCRK